MRLHTRHEIGRRARRLPVLAAATALVAPVLIGLSAGPAAANASCSTIDSPSADASYGADVVISISATVKRGSSSCGYSGFQRDDAATVSLYLRDPSGNQEKLGEASGSTTGQISKSFSTRCAYDLGTSCGNGERPARNGSWTVVLMEGTTTKSSRSFTISVKPQAPTGVSASPVDETTARVSWNANKEPDLASYDLLDGQGNVLQSAMPKSTVCEGVSCSVDVPFSEDEAAGDHAFAVRALRPKAPGSSTMLTSKASDSATVTLTGPPPPSPEPTPEPSDPGTGGGGDGTGTGGGGGGGTGTGGGGNGTGTGGGGGSTSGPSTAPSASASAGGHGGKTGSSTEVAAARQRSIARNFKNFAAPLGIVKLPPLPVLPGLGSQAEPDGTYAPVLAYGDKYGVVPQVVKSVKHDTGLVGSITTVFDARRLWTSIAVGLLMLLGSAHVRRFTRITDDD